MEDKKLLWPLLFDGLLKVSPHVRHLLNGDGRGNGYGDGDGNYGRGLR